MDSNINAVVGAVGRLSLRIGLVALSLAMVWLDVAVFHTDILEISFTEVTQELMLFACALLFWCAPAPRGGVGFNSLAGGFFACLLMRELDGLFDPISHSAWCWPFLVVAAVSIGVAGRGHNRVGTIARLAAFTRTPAFATLSTGFAVLVFSRVFGMGALWHHILQGGYARLAKTTVEEGVELLAYALWLAASLEYYWGARRAARAVVPVAAAVDAVPVVTTRRAA